MNSDWSNWSVQERCVAELIIEMFEDRDPSGRMAIEPKNIYEEYYYRLKAMWVPKYSLSADRQKGVIQIFGVLTDRGELIQPNEHSASYYLTKDGCLYQELKIRTGNTRF